MHLSFWIALYQIVFQRHKPNGQLYSISWTFLINKPFIFKRLTNIFAIATIIKPIVQMNINDSHLNVNRLVTKLFETYACELRHYFLGYTHDEMAAEDMLQDLFFKILRIDLIEENSAKHLLYCIARRIIIDDSRHKKYIYVSRQYFHNLKNEYQTCTIYDELDQKLLLELEEHRLLHMPTKRAKVYRLWRTGELSFKEIGQRLSISQRTAETHVYLAVKEMKDFFNKVI